MKKLVSIAALAIASVSFAASASAASWGQLNSRVGGWGKNQVMKKGYLAGLIQKNTSKHHAAFAPKALEGLKGLNTAHGKCSGRWPNFRMALANVVATKQGAGAALAGPLDGALKAIQGGCALVGKGGQAAVVKGLQGALAALRGKAKPFYMHQLRTAINWIKKPNLWAKK